jgi:transcription elongation factor GreA
MAERAPITRSGKERLSQELARLKSVDRPKIVQDIEVARGHGDLSENAEYHAAKERQGHIEGRINMLEDYLSRAEIVELGKVDGTRVVFGVTVKLYDESADKELRYTIVGEMESDIQKGMISITSPIAKALIGKEVGDVVSVQAPGGVRELEIVDIIVQD